MTHPDRSRRDVLKSAALAVAAPFAGSAMFGGGAAVLAADPPKDLLVPSAPDAVPDRFKGLKVGVATYTFHALPRDVAIKGCHRVGVRYVSIKESHLPLKSTTEERKKVLQEFLDAGLTPLSCGNISLSQDEAAARNAFEYVRDVNAKVMVCAPKMDCLPLLDKLVKEYDIRLAIHNHGPEDKAFPSPYEVQAAIKDLDPRIGYCIDVGHSWRAGKDPVKAILDCRDRLYDIHMKDVTEVKGKKFPLEVGRGIMDIKGILAALLEVKFAGHVGFEYEKDANDPLAGLAESIGYVRGILSTM